MNLRGELIGLTTTAATIAGHEQPAGYAIPINATIRRIIDTLKQGREVEYGMLGVGFGQLSLESPIATGSRLTLAQVFPGGPAARAGLAAGDIVTRVAERTRDRCRRRPIGRQHAAAVHRDESRLRPRRPACHDERHAREAGSGRQENRNRAAGRLARHSRRLRDSTRGRRIDPSRLVPRLDPEGCVLVAEVEEKSVAWNAGVRKGMFISHVGGKRVTTPAEFQAAAQTVGDKFDIRLTQPAVGEPAEEKQNPPAK